MQYIERFFCTIGSGREARSIRWFDHGKHQMYLLELFYVHMCGTDNTKLQNYVGDVTEGYQSEPYCPYRLLGMSWLHWAT